MLSKQNLSFLLLLLFPFALTAQRVKPEQLKPVQNFKSFPAGAIYQDATANPAARAHNVIKYLTFDEKLSLTGGYLSFCFPGVQRLGLRPITMADASQGVRLTSIASKSQSVSFPSMQALASTWNAPLAQQFGQAMGEECIAHGVDCLLGPGINMQRSSEGGRNYEYMGEDPLLTANIATNYVLGLQSKKIVATAKHFIANDQEFVRHIESSDLSERTLREIYLAPWKAVIEKAHLGAIMTANNSVNGIPNSMSQPLLRDILRDEFGFKGVAMTDWQNTNYFPNLQYLVATSGLTLMMSDNDTFSDYIKAYVGKYPAKKSIVEAELDQMVFYNLYTFFNSGAYDRTPTDEAMLQKNAAHEQVARKCAQEAICLLKNEGNILPLSTKKHLLLTGPEEIHSGTGSGFVVGFNHTTFADGLKNIYGSNLTTTEKPTDEQISKADVVLYRLNKKAGEGYDIPFANPDSINNTIKKLCSLNKNVIVLINSGNGMDMPWLDQVKAVLWDYMLGQTRGLALADIISGRVNPSGHLPFTVEKDFKDSPDPDFNYLGGKPFWQGNNGFYKEYWKATGKKAKSAISPYVQPQQLVHVPYSEGVFMGYRWYEKYNKPVYFPFGYGLSYTTFSYSNLKLSAQKINITDSVTVTLTVKNTGKAAGADVVQLYIADPVTTVERPVKELKAFQKVFLKSGQSKTVQFVVNKSDLSFWDEVNHAWKAEPGEFQVMLGRSSADILLKQSFMLN